MPPKPLDVERVAAFVAEARIQRVSQVAIERAMKRRHKMPRSVCRAALVQLIDAGRAFHWYPLSGRPSIGSTPPAETALNTFAPFLTKQNPGSPKAGDSPAPLDEASRARAWDDGLEAAPTRLQLDAELNGWKTSERAREKK